MAAPSSKTTREYVALVVDANATSRSILAAQLRAYGISKVTQCNRIHDARNRLEHMTFDYVLCEQSFSDGDNAGQTLLDDLRRAKLLPFSTVFFMVTGEASYASVAEAAESALDGYLLKPFAPSALFERLRLARKRKEHLSAIFEAIEMDDFEMAAGLCVERFVHRGPYWLYAARIGTELLLRLGRHEQAKKMFEAVIAARALPWAKLGVARAQIEGGQNAQAAATLQGLIEEDASFADAYDVLGRAQIEQGQFEAALETYRLAVSLTPDSLVRVQKLGLMSYYLGERAAARTALARAVQLGIDSKLFDFQSLVLFAFSCFDEGDTKGLDRCRADFARALERHGDSLRIRRFARVAATLHSIAQRKFSDAVDAVRDMAQEITQPDFDFEAACNLVALIATLATTSIALDEAQGWIQKIGMRYAHTRALTQLLASACAAHAGFADQLRACLPVINQLAEQAVAQSLKGDAAASVTMLLERAQESRNSKLLELAQQLLTRHGASIADAALLQVRIDALRPQCGHAQPRALLGGEGERAPGGLSLRARAAAAAPVRAAAAAPVRASVPSSASTDVATD
jgi:tetratricopeptide (TPR) repeat protein